MSQIETNALLGWSGRCFVRTQNSITKKGMHMIFQKLKLLQIRQLALWISLNAAMSGGYTGVAYAGSIMTITGWDAGPRGQARRDELSAKEMLENCLGLRTGGNAPPQFIVGNCFTWIDMPEHRDVESAKSQAIDISLANSKHHLEIYKNEMLGVVNNLKNEISRNKTQCDESINQRDIRLGQVLRNSIQLLTKIPQSKNDYSIEQKQLVQLIIKVIQDQKQQDGVR